MKLLLDFKSVRDNASRVTQVATNFDDEVVSNTWHISPGDGTVYTVRLYDQCVLVHVGYYDCIMERSQDNQVLVAIPHPQTWQPQPILLINNPAVSEYDKAVLEYFALLALGFTTIEPNELASRRPVN